MDTEETENNADKNIHIGKRCDKKRRMRYRNKLVNKRNNDNNPN